MSLCKATLQFGGSDHTLSLQDSTETLIIWHGLIFSQYTKLLHPKRTQTQWIEKSSGFVFSTAINKHDKSLCSTSGQFHSQTCRYLLNSSILPCHKINTKSWRQQLISLASKDIFIYIYLERGKLPFLTLFNTGHVGDATCSTLGNESSNVLCTK